MSTLVGHWRSVFLCFSLILEWGLACFQVLTLKFASSVFKIHPKEKKIVKEHGKWKKVIVYIV